MEKHNTNNTSSIPLRPFVRSFGVSEVKNEKNKTIVALVLIISAGILSGYLLSVTFRKSVSLVTSPGGSVTSGSKAGVNDNKTFSDSAEGELQAGGIKGEGTHKLIRPGGDSQTVYLTSSVLDLNQYVGKKVRVKGQTFSAKSAGWLMDVGLVEVLQ